MIIRSLILIGIEVDIIQGTTAEKKIISEIQVTATTYLVAIEAPVTNTVGRDISAILVARAWAATVASGSCTAAAKGRKI